ncbi:hypothetical protein Cpir12675_001981 [Ceratocystis pirilliformis]|uniref:Uncharacterized protein n=1 Tax=Ceratocystis pirilliformis TaxID=259994 RepID=A0ABR3ZDB3_9PEZI
MVSSKVPLAGARATTPSCNESGMIVHTPPTPRFGGYEDHWAPYSPRKSARIAERKTLRTPSPPPFSRTQTVAFTPAQKTAASKTASVSFTSPMVSPRKKTPQGLQTPRKQLGSSRLTLDPACLSSSSKIQEPSSSSTNVGSAGMLTPAKTPRKAALRNENLDSISRNIFSASTTLVDTKSPELTPRRRRVKKYTGSSLDSIIADEPDEEDPDIPIFTDAADRPFVIRNTEDDPFLRKAPSMMPPPTPRRRSPRKNVLVAGEGRITVEDAIKRDDGIIYTFRGKKFLRKFSPEREEADGIRTRSGLKPRLLFPPKKTQSAPSSSLEDEEADTDVEDHIKNEIIIAEDAEEQEKAAVTVTPPLPATPTKPITAGTKTPKSARLILLTPPESHRSTRSSGKFFDALPIKRSSAVFEQWRSTGAKRRRAADDDDSEPVLKRARA